MSARTERAYSPSGIPPVTRCRMRAEIARQENVGGRIAYRMAVCGNVRHAVDQSRRRNALDGTIRQEGRWGNVAPVLAAVEGQVTKPSSEPVQISPFRRGELAMSSSVA